MLWMFGRRRVRLWDSVLRRDAAPSGEDAAITTKADDEGPKSYYLHRSSFK